MTKARFWLLVTDTENGTHTYLHTMEVTAKQHFKVMAADSCNDPDLKTASFEHAAGVYNAYQHRNGLDTLYIDEIDVEGCFMHEKIAMAHHDALQVIIDGLREIEKRSPDDIRTYACELQALQKTLKNQPHA